MKGIVSSLAISPTADGILAVGTFTRNIGLYASAGSGECIGVFSVAGTEAETTIGGAGITQVLWSPCGRYLYICERKSDGVLIYDIRVEGKLVGWLEGRTAGTNQRLGVDIVPTDEGGGHEVWAGGTDGMVRIWRNPHEREGGQEARWTWKGHGGEYWLPETLTMICFFTDALRAVTDI